MLVKEGMDVTEILGIQIDSLILSPYPLKTSLMVVVGELQEKKKCNLSLI